MTQALGMSNQSQIAGLTAMSASIAPCRGQGAAPYAPEARLILLRLR